MLGGNSVMGKSFIPSSNFACLAIFTCSVSKSSHRMLRVVFGMKPRNIPLRELLQNFAGRGVEGQTHTLQPNVRKLRRLSFLLVTISIGDLVCPQPTKAFRMRII